MKATTQAKARTICEQTANIHRQQLHIVAISYNQPLAKTIGNHFNDHFNVSITTLLCPIHSLTHYTV